MNQTPHAFPIRLRDTVSADFAGALKGLDHNERFVVKRLVALAYAEGQHDGWLISTVLDDNHQ